MRQPRKLPENINQIYSKYDLGTIEGGHPFPIEFFTKKFGKGNTLQKDRQIDWIYRNKDKLFNKDDLVFQSKNVNKYFKGQIGELKKLAADGKLTSDVVLRALGRIGNEGSGFLKELLKNDPTSRRIIINLWNPPPHLYWAMDDYIYFNMNNGTNYNHLYKVHSSNTEIPITQLTDGDRSLMLAGSYSTDLDKLALISFNDTDSLSDLFIYELETNQLSYIDTIQGKMRFMQTWSNDNSKVAIGAKYNLWGGYHAPIQIYDFVNVN